MPRRGGRGYARPMRVGPLLLRGFIGALCVAALAACVAVLQADAEGRAGRVIATSLFFAIAGAGVAEGVLVARTERSFGAITIALAAMAFLLLAAGVWLRAHGTYWDITGSVVVLSLETTYVSFVLDRREPDDPPAVRAATRVAVWLAVTSGAGGLLLTIGVLNGATVGALYYELLAVIVICQLLLMALGPLLRTLPSAGAAPAVAGSSREDVAREIERSADRLEGLAAADPLVHEECERLRRLARTVGAGAPQPSREAEAGQAG
jgi:hypothetical protein